MTFDSDKSLTVVQKINFKRNSNINMRGYFTLKIKDWSTTSLDKRAIHSLVKENILYWKYIRVTAWLHCILKDFRMVFWKSFLFSSFSTFGKLLSCFYLYSVNLMVQKLLLLCFLVSFLTILSITFSKFDGGGEMMQWSSISRKNLLLLISHSYH